MLLHEKLKNYDLLLGTKSPRRRELMSGADLPFTVVGFDVDESYPADMQADEVPLHLARLKSEGYPARLSANQILITADTIVIADGRIMGKPSDRDTAIRMLQRLSGRRHTVVTGVVMRDTDRMHGFSAQSQVWFRHLDKDEIEYYVDTYSPYDKAGSYGIQEWIGYVGIERIEGSFYNVMGLPIQQLYVNLNKFISK